MMSGWGRAVGAGMLVCAATAAGAQESTNRVTTISDWNVFTEDASGELPKQCWGVSKPVETVNTRDGQPAQVRRDDILLFVTFTPGKAGEISFTGGYPFADGSTVDVTVDGTAFQMFTEGEWAWTGSPDEDQKLLAALKAGSTATLNARSGRGTQTADTFSLRGFTAAMEDAEKRCQ
jgi:hypothetical protein